MGSVIPDEPSPAFPPSLAKDGDRAESEQEVDIWWGGYNSRAALPSFALSVGLTAIIGLTAAYIYRAYDLPPLAVRYTAYALIGIVWLVQLSRWIYCVLTKTYRLTSRRLFLERPFFYSPFVAIDLTKVTDVHIEQTAVERKLRVGRLRISVQDLPTVITIEGLYQPGDLVIEFRRLVQEARENVEATKILHEE